MPGYAVDRKYSDRFIPAIKQLIGPNLIEVAPKDVDMKEAADLIVLRARDVTIAARIRRPGYAADYPYDVTFRFARASGVTTEFEKIKRGWGDLYFYGHDAGTADPAIARWWLIDLCEFRYALANSACRRVVRYTLKDNIDAETSFIAFDLRSFPTDVVNLIRAASHPLPTQQIELTAAPSIAPTFEPYGDLFPVRRGGS